MAEASAHLIDHVLPEVPIRQWVLSFPWPLRLLYSTRPEALSCTLGIVTRAIESHLIHKAVLTRKQGSRSGAVTFIQRFGSALNLNVHLHMLIPDGVYTFHRGKPRFHHVTAPTAAELDALLDRIIARITRHLLRDGLLAQDAEQPYLDLPLEDTLDAFGAASIQYRVILGPQAGHKTLTLRDPARISGSHTEKPFTAARDGFSLNAAAACQPWQRQRLERLCRYVTRPPLALERLSVDDDGRLRYALKHPYSDGTTHFLFQPLDLLARLAALVPRPRVNLTRYHGVFAPNSNFRACIVPKRKVAPTPPNSLAVPDRHQSATPNPQGMSWAQRLKRIFDIDLSHCPLCGGTLRVIADITDPAVIDRILTHIKKRPSTACALEQPGQPAKYTPPYISRILIRTLCLVWTKSTADIVYPGPETQPILPASQLLHHRFSLIHQSSLPLNQAS